MYLELRAYPEYEYLAFLHSNTEFDPLLAAN
jgi:hypothetical protein